MSKVTKAANHLNAAEILDRIKHSKSFWRIRRWMIIHHALVCPSPASEIAQRFCVSKHTVHQLLDIIVLAPSLWKPLEKHTDNGLT